MKDLIKEVALEGAEKFGVVADDSEIVDLVTWCLAELSKRAEAVYVVTYIDGICMLESDDDKELPVEFTKLFTFPPIHDIAEIENRTAEACAKAAESDSEPAMNWLSSAIPGKFIADELRSGEWRKYK